MDSLNSAQDVHRCDLCENALVHSYCDFCYVNLCKPCVVDHISDGYDKHKIVSFQQRKSTLIYPKCGKHEKNRCDFNCKNCTIFVCSFCMGSKQHKGHDFSKLEEIYRAKKETIEKDLKELENLFAPSYEEVARDLEIQIENLDEGYRKLTKVISKQGEEWHREIDNILNKMKIEIGTIKVKHLEILKKHLNEIKHTQALIQQAVQDLKKIEESNEVSPAIKYQSKNGTVIKHLPRVKVHLPTFIPKPIDHAKLYSFFGEITPLFRAKTVQSSVKELLNEPKLLKTIKTGYEGLSSVAYVDEQNIWTSGETGDIKCFTINGLLHQTIKTKSEIRPSDLAIDNGGDLLYCDGTDRTVNRVKNDQTRELIRLQGWVPVNMCVTSSSSDLLVVMFKDDKTECKVVRYLGSSEKQTIQFDNEGKPLFSGNGNFKCISETQQLDVCVADMTAKAVVVVNHDGKLRYRYVGHPTITKNNPFQPYGITTDSQSRILTSDFSNSCIHIVDGNGVFLAYIDRVNCNLKLPLGLCVDNSGKLFVCEFKTGCVKKIKYSK